MDDYPLLALIHLPKYLLPSWMNVLRRFHIVINSPVSIISLKKAVNNEAIIFRDGFVAHILKDSNETVQTKSQTKP